MEQQREYSGSEHMKELGDKIIDATKQELFIAMRYLFAPLNQLEPACNRGVNFLATDGSAFYYNPIKLIEKYKESQVME